MKNLALLTSLIAILFLSSCAQKYGAPNTRSRNNSDYPVSDYNYKYYGSGDFSEISRTYIPGIAVTYGFTIALPNFKPLRNTKIPYYLGVLPDQNNTLHVDLALAIPKYILSPEEELDVLNKTPEQHSIKCALINTDTREIIASNELPIHSFPRMKNRILRRNYILNLLQIEPNRIPNGAAVEVMFEYTTNNIPLERDMMVIVTMDAPTA